MKFYITVDNFKELLNRANISFMFDYIDFTDDNGIIINKNDLEQLCKLYVKDDHESYDGCSHCKSLKIHEKDGYYFIRQVSSGSGYVDSIYEGNTFNLFNIMPVK